MVSDGVGSPPSALSSKKTQVYDNAHNTLASGGNLAFSLTEHKYLFFTDCFMDWLLTTTLTGALENPLNLYESVFYRIRIAIYAQQFSLCHKIWINL